MSKLLQAAAALKKLKKIKKGGLVEYQALTENNSDLITASKTNLNEEEDALFRVKNITEKPEKEGGGWNSAGIYLFSPADLKKFN